MPVLQLLDTARRLVLNAIQQIQPLEPADTDRQITINDVRRQRIKIGKASFWIYRIRDNARDEPEARHSPEGHRINLLDYLHCARYHHVHWLSWLLGSLGKQFRQDLMVCVSFSRCGMQLGLTQ